MNKKFSTSLIILIIFVLAVVVGIAIYLNYSSSNTNQNKYFEIKKIGLSADNLGIRFKTPSEIVDLLYDASMAKDGAVIINFSTSSLTKKGGKFCEVKDAPLGYIDINTKAPSGGLYNSSNLILNSNGYYFYYFSPQSVCSSEKTIADTQTQQAKVLKNSLKTVEIISGENNASALYKSDFDSGTLYGILYRSDDGGNTWKEILRQYKGHIIYATDFKKSNIIYTGDTGGNSMSEDMNVDIFKSTNKGEDWINISKGITDQVGVLYGVSFIQIDQNDSNIVKVTVVAKGKYIDFKSTDGGNTWVKQ